MRELGGRHAIYGVAADDFGDFLRVFVDVLAQSLGPDVMGPAVQLAWRELLTVMAKVMLAYVKAAHDGVRGPMFLITPSGSSKQVYVQLELTTLAIYADDKFKKLRSHYSLEHVDSLSFPGDETAFQIELHCPSTPFTLRLAADSKAAFDLYVFELTWRVVRSLPLPGFFIPHSLLPSRPLSAPPPPPPPKPRMALSVVRKRPRCSRPWRRRAEET